MAKHYDSDPTVDSSTPASCTRPDLSGIHDTTDDAWHGLEKLSAASIVAQGEAQVLGLIRWEQDDADDFGVDARWVRTTKGAAYLAEVQRLVQALTQAQRKWLQRFSEGYGYGGRGASVALRSLSALGLARGEGPEAHNLAVVVEPLGRAVLRAYQEQQR